MKSHYLILPALTLASAGNVLADLDVYLTGATAFRAVAFTVLDNRMFTAETHCGGGGDTQYTFTGTIDGISGTVRVYGSYSGSVKGTLNVLQGNNVTFKAVGCGSTFDQAPNLAFADNQLENMPFDTTGLSSTEVGVVPFLFVKSANAELETAINNVTLKIVDPLFSSGGLEKHMFTGNPLDVGSYVFVTGRAWTSGTRIITAAETAYGITRTATFTALSSDKKVWELANDTNTGDNDQFGYGYGYESGSNLKTALMNALADAGPCIGPMSVGEAKSSSGGGVILAGDPQRLMWCGVPYTRDNVRTGKYTYWSYERLVFKTSDYTGDLKTFIDKFVTEIDNELKGDTTTDASAIAMSDMGVQRANDGSPVTDSYDGDPLVP